MYGNQAFPSRNPIKIKSYKDPFLSLVPTGEPCYIFHVGRERLRGHSHPQPTLFLAVYQCTVRKQRQRRKKVAWNLAKYQRGPWRQRARETLYTSGGKSLWWEPRLTGKKGFTLTQKPHPNTTIPRLNKKNLCHTWQVLTKFIIKSTNGDHTYQRLPVSSFNASWPHKMSNKLFPQNIAAKLSSLYWKNKSSLKINIPPIFSSNSKEKYRGLLWPAVRRNAIARSLTTQYQEFLRSSHAPNTPFHKWLLTLLPLRPVLLE